MKHIAKLGKYHIGGSFKGGLITDICSKQGKLKARMTVSFGQHSEQIHLHRVTRHIWKERA